ncbi:MAG: hypothetical protein G8345_00750 [Magnetococcales bacterium]|nr:conjugal transfer protein TraH [Magnetococcales bacterium]NGZ25397.1 hypothetical protein [Magnetococcales bacterium]
MSRGKIITAVANIIVMLGLFLPLSSWGDLDQEMMEMFNSMSNFTPADFYMSQRRGVVTGGNFVVRNKLTNPTLLAFTPPSAKAGCGGIDIFGGSFSYINKDQFIALMRSIASNAAGYAFQLALEGMCPECAAVMTKLQKDIQFINSLMKNSCQAAKDLVNASGIGPGLRRLAGERQAQATYLSTKTGFISDYFGAASSTSEPEANARSAGQVSDLTGNVVKQSLDESAAMTWFTNGDDSLKMALMSLTGTLIIHMPSDGNQLKYKMVAPTIKVRDLLEGGQVQIYQCDSEQCLEPNQVTINLTGLRQRVRQVMFGGCSFSDAGCMEGVVNKIFTRATDNSTFTTQEKQFIEADPVGSMALIQKFGEERGEVRKSGDQLVDIIATEMTYSLMDELFNTVTNAVSGISAPADSSMLTVMRTNRDDLNEERRVVAQKRQALTNWLEEIDTQRRMASDESHEASRVDQPQAGPDNK